MVFQFQLRILVIGNLFRGDTLETSHQALFNRKVGKKLLAPWGVIINSEMITWVLSYSSISALTADFNTHNFTDTSRRFSSSFVVVFKDKKPPPSRVHVISKFIPYPNQPQSLWTANYFKSLK